MEISQNKIIANLMLGFTPQLLNSASRWATTKEELQELYECPYTGAVTIRTSLLNGFEHDNAIHQYEFFSSKNPGQVEVTSLNTLGYSPISLTEYISIVRGIYQGMNSSLLSSKPFIFSVAGSPQDIKKCRHCINTHRIDIGRRCLMEINLSCPNIAGKPPPGYSKSELLEYLVALGDYENPTTQSMEVGIKIPPYTFQGQFDDLISVLLLSKDKNQVCPITFITAVNTLGCCLYLNPSDKSTPVLSSENGTGIGGLAGAALHPLALGNVALLRRLLDVHGLQEIEIIGVGGVADAAGFTRMKNVGASAIGVGTALGSDGVKIFGKIVDGLEQSD